MPESVIIGGGPAGAAAAVSLARSGRGVTLIERTTGDSDKVCGDFLSPEAIASLEALGIDLSAASTISAIRLVCGNRVAHARLPFVARGLSRRILDGALLRKADHAGATVLRGHRVRAIALDNGRMQLDCGSFGVITTDAVFLATGKHDLRGVQRSDRGNGLVGLKMYYTCRGSQIEAIRNHVELVLLNGGYAGLQLVERDQAVLCILLPSARLRAVGGRWESLLDSLTAESPHLRDRLDGAVARLEQPVAVAGLPYGYVHAARDNDPAGLYRLGDQAAVIPSLTGDGVALALVGGALAARDFLQGRSATLYQRNLAAALKAQIGVASAVHRLCMTQALQPLVATACRFAPSLIRLAASATRANRLTHGRYAG